MSGGEEIENVVEVQELPQELKDIKNVLYQARGQQTLTKGIRQCLKVIENKRALFCFLAEDCDHAQYTGLVKALCAEQGVKVVMVPEKAQLGEWANQCKMVDGKATKVRNCSCAVVGTNLRHSDEVKRLIAKTN